MENSGNNSEAPKFLEVLGSKGFVIDDDATLKGKVATNSGLEVDFEMPIGADSSAREKTGNPLVDRMTEVGDRVGKMMGIALVDLMHSLTKEVINASDEDERDAAFSAVYRNAVNEIDRQLVPVIGGRPALMIHEALQQALLGSYNISNDIAKATDAVSHKVALASPECQERIQKIQEARDFLIELIKESDGKMIIDWEKWEDVPEEYRPAFFDPEVISSSLEFAFEDSRISRHVRPSMDGYRSYLEVLSGGSLFLVTYSIETDAKGNEQKSIADMLEI